MFTQSNITCHIRIPHCTLLSVHSGQSVHGCEILMSGYPQRSFTVQRGVLSTWTIGFCRMGWYPPVTSFTVNQWTVKQRSSCARFVFVNKFVDTSNML